MILGKLFSAHQKVDEEKQLGRENVALSEIYIYLQNLNVGEFLKETSCYHAFLFTNYSLYFIKESTL